MTRHFLSDEAQARFSQARIDVIATLGRLARERAASFIVVAGDVFESNQLSRETLARAVDALAAVPVPVFLLPGNHDPLDAASLFQCAAFAAAGEHVTVITDTNPRPVPGCADVEVVGAPWTSKRPDGDICAAMLANLAPAGARVRIALAHGQVDSLTPEAGRPDTIVQAVAEAALSDGRVHYLALGDRHSVTPVGESGAIWYSGTPLVTAFREAEPNHALLVELNAGVQAQVERLPVGGWSFIHAEERIDNARDVQRLEDWLGALPDKACTVVRLALAGSVNLATAAALDGLLERHSDLFAGLLRHERSSDLTVVPDELDEDGLGLSGYARSAWNELASAAHAPDAEAIDALRLFYRLSRPGG